MKKKTFPTKMMLNKKTVANLTSQELRNSRAGGAIITEGTCTVDCKTLGQLVRNQQSGMWVCELSVGQFC